ncbi:NVEALA domain-containing protein [Phocaeicola sp.]
MKKNILKVNLIVIFALFAGYNMYRIPKSDVMSDLGLANVEALASNKGSDDWYCVGESGTCLKDEQGVIYGTKYDL